MENIALISIFTLSLISFLALSLLSRFDKSKHKKDNLFNVSAVNQNNGKQTVKFTSASKYSLPLVDIHSYQAANTNKSNIISEALRILRKVSLESTPKREDVGV